MKLSLTLMLLLGWCASEGTSLTCYKSASCSQTDITKDCLVDDKTEKISCDSHCSIHRTLAAPHNMVRDCGLAGGNGLRSQDLPRDLSNENYGKKCYISPECTMKAGGDVFKDCPPDPNNAPWCIALFDNCIFKHKDNKVSRHCGDKKKVCENQGGFFAKCDDPNDCCKECNEHLCNSDKDGKTYVPPPTTPAPPGSGNPAGPGSGAMGLSSEQGPRTTLVMMMTTTAVVTLTLFFFHDANF